MSGAYTQSCPGCRRTCERAEDDAEHSVKAYTCVTTPNGVPGCGATWCPTQTYQGLKRGAFRGLRGRPRAWATEMARRVDREATVNPEHAGGIMAALVEYLETVSCAPRDALPDAVARVLGRPTMAERTAALFRGVQ